MQKIAIAIDTSSTSFNIQAFAKQFPRQAIFKIGWEYFSKFGIPQNLENDIFLDLKLFDIPNTLYHAAKNLLSDKIHFFTVATEAGANSIEAVIRARNEMNLQTKIICVTKLTSQAASNEDVLFLTNTALNAGADGIVCSANEALAVRQKFGEKPIIITPGIRPVWHQTEDDQKRTATPKQAFANGANVLVIGRPIMQHSNPKEAFEMICNEGDCSRL